MPLSTKGLILAGFLVFCNESWARTETPSAFQSAALSLLSAVDFRGIDKAVILSALKVPLGDVKDSDDLLSVETPDTSLLASFPKPDGSRGSEEHGIILQPKSIEPKSQCITVQEMQDSLVGLGFASVGFPRLDTAGQLRQYKNETRDVRVVIRTDVNSYPCVTVLQIYKPNLINR